MKIEQLLVFNLALVVSIVSPGPAFLVAIQTTISNGRRSGIAIGCGLGLVAALWTLMALLGLDLVFAIFPWAYAVVKTIGSVYLIFIGWTMWKGARKSPNARPIR